VIRQHGGRGNDRSLAKGGRGDDKLIYKAGRGQDKAVLKGGRGDDKAVIRAGNKDIKVTDAQGRVLYQQGDGSSVVKVKNIEDLKIKGKGGRTLYSS
jgi:Ca2+-binding RTX toxin-like protein